MSAGLRSATRLSSSPTLVSVLGKDSVRGTTSAWPDHSCRRAGRGRGLNLAAPPFPLVSSGSRTNPGCRGRHDRNPRRSRPPSGSRPRAGSTVRSGMRRRAASGKSPATPACSPTPASSSMPDSPNASGPGRSSGGGPRPMRATTSPCGSVRRGRTPSGWRRWKTAAPRAMPRRLPSISPTSRDSSG
jgi:hypothetical protein